MEDLQESEVIISREELGELQKDSDLLDCLYACGVDNWSGFSEAMEMFEEDDE